MMPSSQSPAMPLSAAAPDPGSKRHLNNSPFLLVRMRLRGAYNSVRRHPAQYVFGVLFMLAVYVGVFIATRRGVRFISNFFIFQEDSDLVAAILQRSLESLFILLMLGVTFSVLTTALHTLYSSDDLPFLLSLPAPNTQVFFLKILETYAGSAMLPALFTLPILVGLGLERGASPIYYPVAFAAVLALYAIPVALGGLLALLLMRIAPAGRVKEVATGVSVVIAAALIFALRILRPERLVDMTLVQMTLFLRRFASFEISWLPSSWTSQAVWGALEGQVTLGVFLLAGLALLLLWLMAMLSSFAYREGWVRALDAGEGKRDTRIKPVPWWEYPLTRLGQAGAVMAKDVRLMLRDPTQWSQLLVLLALAGVYLVSVSSLKIEGLDSQRFRDAMGTLNLLFMGFVLSGVGIRMTYPLLSLEGEGFWLLRTAPIRARGVVLSKFCSALPIMLLLGGALGALGAQLLDVSPALALASWMMGLCSALVISGLGVGLGSVFPRLGATSPNEIPLSSGGLLFMGSALLHSLLATVSLAFPIWRYGAEFTWASGRGLGFMALTLLLMVLGTVIPLLLGSYALARYE